ncbi:MAG: right-handed parallel beta-helix repeat-containing protein [Chloroflexota bacterium]|nr:MAG: right-handed parallel beta-helix repeat-containing protein [Chloroflexota bacterium]
MGALPFGEYTVAALIDGWNPCADAPSRYRHEYYSETLDSDLAIPIVLSETNDTVTGIDFTLDIAGVIVGTVYAADGQTPLPDIWVSDGENYYANCTNQSGQFGLGGLPFGEYKIAALLVGWNPCTDAPSRYRHEFYSETLDVDLATPIVLSETNDTATNIDFTLDRAGAISGTVYDEGGTTPLSNVYVYDSEDNYGECTDVSGRYGLGGLPFGEYKIGAGGGWNPCADGPSEHLQEWYFETDEVDLATVIVLTETADFVTGVDFTLTPAAIVEQDRYVATNGSDVGPNDCLDSGAPCATVDQAIEMANPGDSILVAQGTYTENLWVDKPLLIAGGYNATDWTQDLDQYETIIDGSEGQTVMAGWDSYTVGAMSVISDTDGINWVRFEGNPVLSPGTPEQQGETVMTFVGDSDGSVLEGLTITGGNGQMGGGVDGGSHFITIRYCLITGNEADGGPSSQGAGGLVNPSGQTTIIDSQVVDNHVNEGAGGVRVHDGLLVMSNTLVTGNTGDAGIHLNGPARLMNVTVAGNDGGIIYNPPEDHTLYVTNTIIYGNDWSIGDEGEVVVSYSIIEDGWDGPGNMEADPWFEDPDNGDYHLLPWSPAIDAGAAEGAPDHDFEGDPRPQNSGFDIGADEFTGVPIGNQGTRYVATSGMAGRTNPCLDPNEPCDSIGWALEVAVGGDDILVAQGAYTENLSVDKTVALQGGYEAAGWTHNPALYETIIDGSANQTEFGDWDGNNIGYPRVISDTGKYRMWYGAWNPTNPGWGNGIGLAESTDGTTWTKFESNPVLGPGEPGEWDGQIRRRHSVLKDDDIYRMWFAGNNDDDYIWRFGYATSPDGIDWDVYPDPVLSPGAGEWDDRIFDPFVLKDGAVFKMWYRGCLSGSCAIGYATSNDGVNWDKHPAGPVLVGTDGEWDEDSTMSPWVIKNGDTFEMWYISFWGGIGNATSPDGIYWAKHDDNPVLYDGGNPSVILEDGTYKMWLSIWPEIGYAESADGVSWELYEGNPVLTPGEPGHWGESVVRFEQGSHTATLDGFTITGGYAESGGGLLIANDGAALVANTIITGNRAHRWAGGVWVSGADVTIRDSQVLNNRTTLHGGAGIEVNSDFGRAHLTLETSTLGGNMAPSENGGGLHVWDASADLYEVVFEGNEAGSGAGLAVTAGSSVNVEGGRFADNEAGVSGGGIMLQQESSLVITGTSIYGNIAHDGEGGGIWVSDSSRLTMAQSWVVANAAPNNEGGGIGASTGEETMWPSVSVENSIIAGNSSGTHGGGLWIKYGDDHRIANTHVVGNQTSEDGAALVTGGEAQIVLLNSLLISNTGNTSIADRDGSGSLIDLLYCDTFGNSPDGTDGVTINRIHCLGQDPATGLNPLMAGGSLPSGVGPDFAGQWMAYDYNLSPNSPVVDAGTPLYDAPRFDIEGSPRDDAPDMGAYERQGLTSDVALTNILPTGPVPVDEPFQVATMLFNRGQEEVNEVGVSCQIEKDSAVVYDEQAVSGLILPLQDAWLSFPTYTPTATGSYTLTCESQLAGDMAPENDVLSQNITVEVAPIPDAWMKDHPDDTGTVHFLGNWFFSPDMWVRLSDDGGLVHENPVAENEGTLYIRLRNRGNAAVSGELAVSWSPGRIAVHCNDWQHIDTISFEDIQPGEERIVSAQWTPPAGFKPGWGISLQAVIDAENDPYDRGYECAPQRARWDNNVAMRSTQVFQNPETTVSSIAADGAEVWLNNVYNLPQDVDLIVERLTFPETGSITIELPAELFDRWRASASAWGSGIEVMTTTKEIHVTGLISATIGAIPMAAAEQALVGLSFSAPEGEEFELNLVQRIVDRVVGGISYHWYVPDETPPQVVYTVPAAGEIGVGIDQPIVIQFDETISPLTLDLALTPDPGSWQLAWNEAGTIVTATHASFTQGTQYHASVTAGDASANVMEAAYEWSLTASKDQFDAFLPLIVK